MDKEVKPTIVMSFGNYTASLVEGKWIYKANDNIPLSTVSTNPKYKDPVQFKIMEEYELHAENRFRDQLKKSVIEIAKFLKEI